jgi:hypothetical protein
MPEVKQPTPSFPLSTGFGIASLGQVYIGEVDQDPTVLGNRINVIVIDTDGSEVNIPPASQPFVLNSAGLFTYNGSVVQLRTSQNYSISVFNSSGVLQYYFPDAAVTDDVATSVISLTPVPTPATIPSQGQVYSKTVGGGVELFYQDAVGNEIQLTLGGALNISLPNDNVGVNSLFANYYQGKVVELVSDAGTVELDWRAGQFFTLTLTEDTTLTFSNLPAIGEGIGQTIMIALQDAGNFVSSFDAGTGYTVFLRAIDNPLTPTLDGLDIYIITVYQEAKVLTVPLYDFGAA